jgi:hypothetical protein
MLASRQNVVTVSSSWYRRQGEGLPSCHMSEALAGGVVESLGATCTIPGATISSDLTGCVGMPATIPRRVPTVGGTALPGPARRRSHGSIGNRRNSGARPLSVGVSACWGRQRRTGRSVRPPADWAEATGDVVAGGARPDRQWDIGFDRVEVLYTSDVSSDERAELEEQVADLEEATEQRMHSVAELLPQSEKMHERADRLSDRAQEHRRRVERRRADETKLTR